VPSGDPEGVRIIDRMNWTGLGIVFPRIKWPDIRVRPEFKQPGVYILTGLASDDDLPTVYIGQGDGIVYRIDAHDQNKEFWTWGIAFVSSNKGLNRGHITWLEYALIERAVKAGRSILDNGNQPQEPALSESEKADTAGFLTEILQILPLVGLRAFEIPKPVSTPKARQEPVDTSGQIVQGNDTIIVPAQREGFERVFLGENCWHAIRISGGMLPRIKYIAAYQTQPISAITHYAVVDSIEPYGEGGKYKVIFRGSAREIGPIPFADAPKGAMQGPRYTRFDKLESAKTLSDLVA
jgi:hypothetical protein